MNTNAECDPNGNYVYVLFTCDEGVVFVNRFVLYDFMQDIFLMESILEVQQNGIPTFFSMMEPVLYPLNTPGNNTKSALLFENNHFRYVKTQDEWKTSLSTGRTFTSNEFPELLEMESIMLGSFIGNDPTGFLFLKTNTSPLTEFKKFKSKYILLN